MGNPEITSQNYLDILVKLFKRIENIVSAFGEIQTAWGFIVLIFLLLFFCYSVIMFSKKVNQQTHLQIQAFNKMGKYEPALYIELNRNLECLRYFLFSYNWKSRIVQAYNNLFTGYDGRRFKKALKLDHLCRVSRFTKIATISKRLNSLLHLFESLRNETENYRNQLGDYFFIARNAAYDYSEGATILQDYCNLIAHKSVLVVGSAGNGKTNLICKLSEIAIKNKIPVMLINSRDINDNCTHYILNKLPVSKKLRNRSALYLHIISLLLLIQRKYFYIFIDAINENDREEFVDSIGQAVDYFSKFPRVRILLTCRSEYFKTRYNIYFDKCAHTPYIFNMMATYYDKRATNKMFITYQNYYNVKGEISLHAKERLLSSLFLMKIFFEVNRDRNENIIELRNTEIYFNYITSVASSIKEINFFQIIQKIADAMITDSQYDWVDLNCIGIDGTHREKLYNVLDDNLIISRTVRSGKGITKSENEVVIFVFDEFRDFCLARCLLLHAESKHDNEYSFFFNKVNEMFQQRQSPVEGVIKYGYYYFKNYGHPELSEKLLTLYSETDVQHIANRDSRHIPQRRFFQNFGLSLIFVDSGEITESEISFLKKYIAKSPNYYWSIFWFLLKNEYSSISPRLDIGIRLLIEDRTSDEIFKILDYFLADQYGYYSTYDERNVSILDKYLVDIKKHNGSLSFELKEFIILLCAYTPYEPILRPYRRFVLEESIYKNLLESLHNTKLKDRVQKLRSIVEGLKSL